MSDSVVTKVDEFDGSRMNDVPGNQNPGAPHVYWVKGTSSLPETVNVSSGIVKYQLNDGHDFNDPSPFVEENQPVVGEVLMEMQSDGHLGIQFFKAERLEMG